VVLDLVSALPHAIESSVWTLDYLGTLLEGMHLYIPQTIEVLSMIPIVGAPIKDLAKIVQETAPNLLEAPVNVVTMATKAIEELGKIVERRMTRILDLVYNIMVIVTDIVNEVIKVVNQRMPQVVEEYNKLLGEADDILNEWASFLDEEMPFLEVSRDMGKSLEEFFILKAEVVAYVHQLGYAGTPLQDLKVLQDLQDLHLYDMSHFYEMFH